MSKFCGSPPGNQLGRLRWPYMIFCSQGLTGSLLHRALIGCWIIQVLKHIYFCKHGEILHLCLQFKPLCEKKTGTREFQVLSLMCVGGAQCHFQTNWVSSSGTIKVLVQVNDRGMYQIIGNTVQFIYKPCLLQHKCYIHV